MAIDGWTTGDRPWFHIGEELGALQADLVGALPSEVVVTGGITANLHALLATFYRPDARRTKIVADELDFPSDLYALQSQIRLHGLDPAEHLVLVPSRDGRTIDEDDLIGAIEQPDVALAWLPSVLYRSGQLLDMPRLAAAAKASGVTIGFDCAHSVGSVPHRLHDWGVDFGVWCTYKYLNAGPGAVGSLFVHERHFGKAPGLAGWWGSDKDRQFDMATRFTPAATAGAWQIGTPSVLGAAALYGSLKVLHEAGIERLRAKSLAHDGAAHGAGRSAPEALRLQRRNAARVRTTWRTCGRRAPRGGADHARAQSARASCPISDRPTSSAWRPCRCTRAIATSASWSMALRAIVERGEHLRFDAERAVVA